MNKPLVGILVGGVLGIFDGLSALVSAPAVAPQIAGIVAGSTVKGIIVGAIVGWYARKVHSVRAGVLFGLVVGLFFAFLVAVMPADEQGTHYWWEIMLPGSVVGAIVGFATQRYGRSPAVRA